MIHLPVNLHPQLARLLQPLTGGGAERPDQGCLETDLLNLAAAFRTFFTASSAFLTVRVGGTGFFAAVDPADPALPTKVMIYGSNEWAELPINQLLPLCVSDEGLAKSYTHDLWPHAPLQVGSLTLPSFYQIVIPLSAKYLACAKNDPNFVGALFLLFTAQPMLTDDQVSHLAVGSRLLSEFVGVLGRQALVQTDLRGGLIHDLKQYLLLTQELLRQLQSGADHAKAVDALSVANSRMLLQANSIMLAYRSSTGQLKISPVPASINEFVEEAVFEQRALFKRARIELECKCEASLPDSMIDPAIFPSVVHNLLDNARKYSKPDTQVQVTTRRVGDLAILEISDQGIGIPEHERQKIFSYQFRASNVSDLPGQGIGLHLVRSIIEAHGGTISASANPHHGTTFSVRLPLGHLGK